MTVPGAAPGGRGQVALVLHTHMPYVEGYGTWPFGEEWLWEALATSYLRAAHPVPDPGGLRPARRTRRRGTVRALPA